MEHTNQLRPRVSKLALTSLFCVLLSIILDLGPWLHSGRTKIWVGNWSAFIFSILAILFGIIAFRKISRNRERLKGRNLAIVGIVLGVIFFQFTASSLSSLEISFKKADIAVVTSDLDYITNALQGYYKDVGHYPSTRAGLRALEVRDPIDDPDNKWNGPYTRFYKKNKAGNPIDPWGNEYRYTSDGKSLTILSYGADGKPGGTGFAADITKAVMAKKK